MTGVKLVVGVPLFSLTLIAADLVLVTVGTVSCLTAVVVALRLFVFHCNCFSGMIAWDRTVVWVSSSTYTSGEVFEQHHDLDCAYTILLHASPVSLLHSDIRMKLWQLSTDSLPLSFIFNAREC